MSEAVPEHTGPAGPIDHRALQRTLFRMQLDPGFAAAVQAREPGALRSTRLQAAELDLLRAIDLRGVEADPGSRRRSQFLRNVAGEFTLTLALVGPRVAEGFTASRFFHGAVAADTRLPLAFAAYLADVLTDVDALPQALLALDASLCAARRAEPQALPCPAPGLLLLSPEVELVRVRAGTFEAAAAIRRALDAGSAVPQLHPPHGEEQETVLIHARPPASAFQLREVDAEWLAPGVAEMLRECRSPRSALELGAYARQRGIRPAELRAVVESFAADRVLLGSAL